MNCAIKDCNKSAMKTYTYSAPLKPSAFMAEKLTLDVPLCKEHAGNRPDTLSLQDLK